MDRTIALTTGVSAGPFGTKRIKRAARDMVQIPPGLLSYFNENKTESAVDLLLAKKRPSIPDDVEWEDVPNYFRAVRAARQIQADLAILLHEIWNAVWDPLPAPWKAKAPHEQVDDGLIDPRTIWDHWYALRAYECDKLNSELLIYADNESGVQIGFNVLRNDKSKLHSRSKNRSGIANWEDDGVTLWSPSGLVKIQKNINLAPLEPFVEDAFKVIKGIRISESGSTK